MTPANMAPLSQEEMNAMIVEWRENNRQKMLRENYVEPVDANKIDNPRLNKPILPYPKMLYHTSGQTAVVHDEADHRQMTDQGWSDTPTLRSQNVAQQDAGFERASSGQIDDEWRDQVEQRMLALEGMLAEVLEHIRAPKAKKTASQA